MERSIVVERKVCAYPIVVGGVIRQQMVKVPLPEHHDMVKAFPSDRSNQTSNMTDLPRRAWRDWPVANAHSSQPAGDHRTIRPVAVTDEVARRVIPWKCFGDLSCDPLRGWICGHIGPDEPSSLQTQDDQRIQQFEPDRRNHKQIDGGDVGGVIAQEGPPVRSGQRGRATTPDHVLGGSRLGDVDTGFQQLTMNAWCTQSGLSRLIARTNARTSAASAGRPTRRRDFQRQYRRKPLRCQRTSVSGLKMTADPSSEGNSR
jgi:hypothetical protein